MLVVSDASPLIALSDAEQLDLLHLAYDEIVIPEEVAQEVFGKKRNRAKPSWIKIRSLTDIRGLAIYAELRSFLDAGESAAIAMALVHDGIVLMDEELGTAECAARGIVSLTTAEVVARLEEDGKIKPTRAARVASALRIHGVFVPRRTRENRPS